MPCAAAPNMEYKRCSSCIPGLGALTGYYQPGQLSPDCAYKHQSASLEDELIKDRVVVGIHDDHTREKLLSDPDLDLDKAIQICMVSVFSILQKPPVFPRNSLSLIKTHPRLHLILCQRNQLPPKTQFSFANLTPNFGLHVVVRSTDNKANPREILWEIQKIHPTLAACKEVAASTKSVGKVVQHTSTEEVAKSLASKLSTLPSNLACHKCSTILPRYCLFRVDNEVSDVYFSSNYAIQTSLVKAPLRWSTAQEIIARTQQQSSWTTKWLKPWANTDVFP
ncbi:K02A2.6-like [Cordylochernes scorpioides]|uniref:K02A2.6-like n=1 Tax=Cordylochernes scorpioides TaxID=51811 RepID=A0ABY6KZ87_9ARAC|nr:K02A2.6-like [Cordylochernes scorpioides]